jgi:hypothetical protein
LRGFVERFPIFRGVPLIVVAGEPLSCSEVLDRLRVGWRVTEVYEKLSEVLRVPLGAEELEALAKSYYPRLPPAFSTIFSSEVASLGLG